MYIELYMEREGEFYVLLRIFLWHPMKRLRHQLFTVYSWKWVPGPPT